MIGIIIFTLFIVVIYSIVIFLDKDDKEEEIIKLLPGYNCGACGFGSCKGMAKAILKDKENLEKCRFLKEEEKNKIKEY